MLKLQANSADQALTRTKHLSVTEEIRQQIINGDLKPGDRLPSYNARRDEHGVHKNTMSKVYAALESEGLIVRRRGSGTFVAERLERKRKVSGVIGLSGLGFGLAGCSPYWSDLLGGAREAALRDGMHLLILDADSSHGWEKADGVLLCNWNHPDLLRPAEIPIVSLLTLIEGVASVAADDEGGTRLATEHLIELGHRRIAYLQDNNGGITENRMSGYRNALKAAGIRPQKEWRRVMCGKFLFGTEFTQWARGHMSKWLSEPGTPWATNSQRCTALLCQNDEAALGAIQALNEVGLRVPEDVSVVGFDGTSFCELTSPRLSTVEMPLREIGAAGVEMLLQQIKADEVMTEHKVLPTQLRLRESTSTPSRHL